MSFESISETKKMAELKEREELGLICPLISTPKQRYPCTSNCKLFRAKHVGFECVFQELKSISWNTMKMKTPR